MARTLIRALAALAICAAAAAHAGSDEGLLVWPGQSAYEAKLANLRITPDAALALLVRKTQGREDHYSWKKPLFVIGDDYFFPSRISKTDVPLEGFYVNGMTGRIEYRKSRLAIEQFEDRLPPGAFSETEVVE